MKLISLEEYIEKYFGTKKQFADHIGVTPQRIQQMIHRDKTAVLVCKKKHIYVSIRDEFPINKLSDKTK